MTLQYVLLTLGILLLLMVLLLNRSPDLLERGQQKLSSMRNQIKHRIKETQYKAKRKKEGIAANNDLQVREGSGREEPSFNFGNDSGAQHDDSQNNFDFGEQADADPVDQALENLEEEAPQAEEEIVSLKELDRKATASGPFANLRQIDYWIKLTPASPIKQSEIIKHLGQWREARETLQLHALTQEEPHWDNLAEMDGDTAVVDVVASHQLLDHGQTIKLSDLIKFDEQAAILAQTLGAEILTMATPEQAHEQSLKLSGFYESHCLPLEVSVYAHKDRPFMGKLVETSAKQQGLEFQRGEYVRLKRMGTQNVLLYRMVAADGGRFDQDMPANTIIERVTFTMMPVYSRSPGRDSKEMLDAVKAFASRVKGNIRIPGVREFHLDQLVRLRNHVSKMENEMLEAGLEPGGQEIRRIFS